MNVYCNKSIQITKEEVLEKYKGLRGLKIETDKLGFVTEVTADVSCIVCGKYHKPFSKAAQRCTLIIIGILREVME